MCCGQLWVRHMICGQSCDGLYHFAFYFCFAGPLPLRSLSHGPLSRVHFGESLVIRLNPEIDHIHLSSEAQCVSHLYPQVDCHMSIDLFEVMTYAGLYEIDDKKLKAHSFDKNSFCLHHEWSYEQIATDLLSLMILLKTHSQTCLSIPQLSRKCIVVISCIS